MLPRWRGAAPIIYALTNGDTETGISIMRIHHKHFDIGEVLVQTKVPISANEKLPDLHEKLGNLGANCLVECLKNLLERLASAQPQSKEGITLGKDQYRLFYFISTCSFIAPKVTSEFARVSWEKMTSSEIYNRERALTGLFSLISSWKGTPVKLLGVMDCGNCDLSSNDKDSAPLKPGYVRYDKKRKVLLIVCANKTLISVEKIGIFGKKVMSAPDFNNGYIKKESVDNKCFK